MVGGYNGNGESYSLWLDQNGDNVRLIRIQTTDLPEHGTLYPWLQCAGGTLGKDGVGGAGK